MNQYEASSTLESQERNRRERVRDFFFRLGLVDVDSQGEERLPRSRIHSAEGGDLEPVRALRQRMVRNPFPQTTLEAMARRDSTSETELQQRLAKIERMDEKHERRRQEVLVRDTEGSSLEPGEVAVLNTTEEEAQWLE